jgi:hypothetical protein
VIKWDNGIDVFIRAVKSNRNQIVFGYQIECFGSNWIKSYANRIEWYFWFSIRYDLIRFGEDFYYKKNVIVKSEKFTKSYHKWFCQLFLTSWWIPPWTLANFTTNFFFRDSCESFLSNRIIISIKSKLNQIERYLSLWSRKSNRIENDSIWQP